jgi:methionine-rich copper-binding protein CopC
MKKIIFSLTAIVMVCLAAQPAFSTSNQAENFNSKKNNKEKEITIGANRESGEMQLHFTADKAGAASITIFNESGDPVLQQTEQVKNSFNTLPLKNATRLKEGTYTVRIILNNETYTTRFMIWK